MSLGSQNIKPNSFHKHLVSHKRRHKTRKRVLIAGLSLTSMVDMFSLLVIFLLQSFSSSPELLTISNGVTLPTASTGSEMVDAPLMSVSEAGVMLDQKLIGTIDEVLKKPELLLVPLAQLRELWQQTHPGLTFPGEINFQAHRDISSVIVSQIMAFLPSQHYASVRLTVVAGSL